MSVHIQVINQVRVKVLDKGQSLWGKVIDRKPWRLTVHLQADADGYNREYSISEYLGRHETEKDNSIEEFRCSWDN